MALHAKEVDITDKRFGEMTCHLKVTIPDDDIMLVTIRDPYLIAICPIVGGTSNSYLVDWRKQTVILFNILRPSGSESIEMGMARQFLEISEIVLHPEESMMIVIYKTYHDDEKCRIHLCRVDIPLDMTPIAQDRSLRPSHLRHHMIESRGVLTPLSVFLSESPFVLSVLSVGLRALSGLSWVLDVIIHIDHTSTLAPRVQADNRDSAVQSHTCRIAIDLTNWTSTTTALDNSIFKPDDRIVNYSLYHWSERTMEQLQGTPIFVVERSGQVEVFIPKFENGDGHEPYWVSWALPGPNSNPTPNPETSQTVIDAYFWKSVVSLFNVHTGKLYACFGKYLCVVQL
ncbi:hypothetical protein SISNIDRAFT_486806 [Sistotremastrum niveocremeum HHB9708]|uniref:Uncharacterized protein n=1 Tax=Sistotremastrum niveocremeum HHB9708 TaxID=1314777 RepID=A0A164TDA5_9AGAM|nr:hypothetical protein SISNIDRAFT_486806 [Sistotremastrum niveocremeum HHB9708]